MKHHFPRHLPRSFFGLAALLPLQLFASEPPSGTLIIIGSIGSWISLFLLPVIYRQIRKGRSRKAAAPGIPAE
jgi:hypothetical protein